jgi:hypothetical protein
VRSALAGHDEETIELVGVDRRQGGATEADADLGRRVRVPDDEHHRRRGELLGAGDDAVDLIDDGGGDVQRFGERTVVACERWREVTKIALIPVSASTSRSARARTFPAAFSGGSLSKPAVTSA